MAIRKTKAKAKGYTFMDGDTTCVATHYDGLTAIKVGCEPTFIVKKYDLSGFLRALEASKARDVPGLADIFRRFWILSE